MDRLKELETGLTHVMLLLPIMEQSKDLGIRRCQSHPRPVYLSSFTIRKKESLKVDPEV